MKKYTILFVALVLTAAILTGCGCRNTKPMNTTAPTTMPTTMPTTTPTTAPTTQQTEPTTRDTTPTSETQETIEDGNGPLPTNATAGADGDTSSATDDTGMGRNARRIPENTRK